MAAGGRSKRWRGGLAAAAVGLAVAVVVVAGVAAAGASQHGGDRSGGAGQEHTSATTATAATAATAEATAAAAAVRAYYDNGTWHAAPLTRFFFGSCSKTERQQPAWARILARAREEPGALPAGEAPVFVFLGDIVYADTAIVLKLRIPATAGELAAHYAAQRVHPDYAPFRAAATVLGVYDDHDYGMNDGDRTYDPATRDASRRLLLDFLGEAADSPRRTQNAVYAVYRWGSAPHRARLILLDNRTMRDPYGGTAAQDMLGEEQWAWLIDELTRHTAEVTFIGAGLQILARGDPPITENWSRLPASQARLLALLATLRVPGVVLLTGDMHFSEINPLTCDGLGYTLFDFTSSGLTHSFSGPINELALRASLIASHRVPGAFYAGRNFGQIDIAWVDRPDGTLDAGRTTITLTSVGVDTGATEFTHTLVLGDLTPSPSPPPPAAALSIADILASRFTWGTRMANGAPPPPPPTVAHLTPASAAATCARQAPTAGLTPACAAFIATCSPAFSATDMALWYATHAAMAVGAVAALAALACAPLAAVVFRAHLPGGATAGLALTAVAYAVVGTFIHSLS